MLTPKAQALSHLVLTKYLFLPYSQTQSSEIPSTLSNNIFYFFVLACSLFEPSFLLILPAFYFLLPIPGQTYSTSPLMEPIYVSLLFIYHHF